MPISTRVDRPVRISILLLAGALTAAVPRVSADNPGFEHLDPASFVSPAPVEADALEGVWQATDGGALFAIIRQPGPTAAYSMVLIESPDREIPPGTPFGTLRPTAVARKYDASVLDRPLRRGSRCRDYIFELSPDGNRITFSHYRRRMSIRLDRWLRYMFRIGIRESNRPEGIDGAVRLGSDRIVTL